MADLIVRIIARNLTRQGVDQSSKEFQRLESAVSQTASRLKVVGIAAAAAIGIGISKYGEHDKKIREISTLLNDVSEKDIKKMGVEISNMSMRFAQSFDSMAKARYDIISAGFTNAADSAEVLEEAAKLAVGGVAEVSSTSLILTRVLNSYVRTAKDAAEVSDVLFTTVRLGQTTIPELAQFIGNVSPVAKVAGLSLKNLGAAMATITLGGLDTATAAVSLRGALLGLASPAVEAKKAMDLAGISVKKFSDGTLDLVETVRQFVGMDLEQLNKFIPDVRAANAVAIMATNFEKLSSNVDEFGNIAGASQVAFEKMEKSAGFRVDQLKIKFGAAVTALGELTFPLADALINVVNWFQGLDEASKSMVTTMGIATAAVYIFRTAIVVTLGPIGLVYAAIGILGAGLVTYAAKSKDAAEQTDTFSESVVNAEGKFETATVDLKKYREEVEKVAKIHAPKAELPEFATAHDAQPKPLTAHGELDTTGVKQSAADMMAEINKMFGDAVIPSPNSVATSAKWRQLYSDLIKQGVDAESAMEATWDSFVNSLEDKDKSIVESWQESQDKQFEAEQEKLAKINEASNIALQVQSDLVQQYYDRKDELAGKDFEREFEKNLELTALREEYFSTDYERMVANLQRQFDAVDLNWRNIKRLNDMYLKALGISQDRFLLGREVSWEQTSLEISRRWVNAFTNTMINPLTEMFQRWEAATSNDFHKFLLNIVAMFAEAVAQMMVEWAALQLVKEIGLPFSGGGITPGPTMPTTIGNAAFGNQIGPLLASRGYISRDSFARAQTGSLIPIPTKTLSITNFERAQTGTMAAGFDTVPILARPGEAIIPTEIVRRNEPLIRQLIAGQDAGKISSQTTEVNNNFNFSISAVDARGVAELVESREFQDKFIRMINNDTLRLTAGAQTVRGEN